MNAMASNESQPNDGSDNNIQVFVRIRPPSVDEPAYSRVVDVDKGNTQIILKSDPNPRLFAFDFVADTDATQESIFQSLGRKVIENCVAGYNGTIFAYGQTGSGKTFTMLGPSDEADNFQHELRGVIPRSFEYLYSLVNREKELHGENKLFLCKCSFLEIYNEQIFDLLEPTSNSLQLRESFKTGVYVSGLSEQIVSNASEAYAVLNSSWMNRKVASTSMNRESSRSHAVFTLQIESKEKKGEIEKIKTSLLNLVDLAGSERQKDTGASGIRLKEAGSINKSLSNLGNVIMSLVSVSRDGKKRFIPYRDSKLTFLLRDSLGGNSKTSLIACVHAGHRCFGETLSTLQFAKRAKMIKNKAVLNENSLGNIQQLQGEIRILKEELRQYKNGIPQQFTPSCSMEDIPELKKMFLQAMVLRQKAEMEKLELHNSLEVLQDICEKKDKAIQTNKMIIKFRDNNIKRLEEKLKGVEVVDSKQESLEHELEILRSQIEHHPQVAKFTLEIRQLQSQIRALKEDSGILTDIEQDAKKIRSLEKMYNDLAYENQGLQKVAESPSQAQQSAATAATVEKLKCKNEELEANLKELKQTLADIKKSAEKKEMYLNSELESFKQTVKELEMVITANSMRTKLEKAALNEMHLQTVKTITTPKKESYRLRNRMIIAKTITPDLDSSIPFDNDNQEEDVIMREDLPEDFAQQAQEALLDQIKQLQDRNTSLDARISEYDTDRVKHLQQQSVLESQLKQLEELLEREKDAVSSLTEQLSAIEPKMRQIQDDKENTSSENHDLRLVLASADKELKEYKEKFKVLETKRERDIEQVQSKMAELESALDCIAKQNEKLLEENENLSMFLETETETRVFQEGLNSKLEQEVAQNLEKIRMLEQNLQSAEKCIIDEKEHRELLVAQLNSEGLEKDKEVLRRMEENQSLLTEYHSIKNMLETHEDSVATLRKVIDERDNKIANIEKMLKLAEDKISHQYVRLQDNDDLITDLRQKCESGQDQITFYKKLEEETTANIQSFKEIIKDKDQQLLNDRSKHEVAIEMLNEDLKILQEAQEELKREYQIVQEQLSFSKINEVVLCKEKQQLQDMLKSKESAELKSKDSQLSELTQQLEELEAVRAERSSENLQLKARVQELENDNERIRADLQNSLLKYQEANELAYIQQQNNTHLVERVHCAEIRASDAVRQFKKSEHDKRNLQSKFQELCLEQEGFRKENQYLKDTETRLTELAEKDNEEKLQLKEDLAKLQMSVKQIQKLYSDTVPSEAGLQIDDIVNFVKMTKDENQKLLHENSDLIGHSNHKQKIKYHELVKNENVQLKNDLKVMETKYKHMQDQHKELLQQLNDLKSKTVDTSRVLKENLSPPHKTFFSADYTCNKQSF